MRGRNLVDRGGDLDRIFDILGGDVTITGVTLQGALTEGDDRGAEIQVAVGTLTLADSVLTDNTAALAGGGLEVRGRQR